MKLTTVFENYEEIPNYYTCDSYNVNPEIEIEEIPEGTKSLAIIVDDPDAESLSGKPWSHWVVWAIFPEKEAIRIPRGSKIGIQGKNDFGKLGWSGPCPPKGNQPHHYFFRVFALNDTLSNLLTGSTKEEVETAMEGKIIEKAELLGIYTRHINPAA